MAPATALKSKPRASAKTATKVLSERDQEVRALARKMADEDLEKIARDGLKEIVRELRSLNEFLEQPSGINKVTGKSHG